LSDRSKSEHQAAVHLLIKFWKVEDEENGGDQFHWINEGVYISIAELMAIARCV